MDGKVHEYSSADSASFVSASPWYHVKPDSAIGPVAYGRIIALHNTGSWKLLISQMTLGDKCTKSTIPVNNVHTPYIKHQTGSICMSSS